MASRGDIEAGRAHVTLSVRNSQLMQGLNAVRKQLSDLAGSAAKFGRGMFSVGAMAAGAFGAMAGALASPIKAAGDLAETISKFEAVFGENAAAMRAWSDDFAKAVGRSKSETMTSLATFQAFFTGLGKGAGEASDLSKEMHSLAIDFASFHNLQDPEAVQRFISALSGSGEVLSMYGVNIMEAALNQKLLAMGFPSISKGATEMQKVMARMAIIKESMGRQGAVGDAIRTADSFSNQMKRLQASIKNTAETIGTALLPVITPIVSAFGRAIEVIGEVIAKNQWLIVGFAKVVAIGFAVSAAIMGIGAAIWFMATPLGAVLAATTGIVAAVTGIAAAIAGGIFAFIRYTELGRTLAAVVGSAFGELRRIVTKAMGGIFDALMAGNFALAGRIAIKGLQLVFAEGIEWIANKIGGVLGDAIGSLATDLIAGNLVNIWMTATQGMAALWDAFTLGIFMAFRAVINSIRSMWNQLITGITVSLLGLAVIAQNYGGRYGQQVANALKTASAAARGLSKPITEKLDTATGVADAAVAAQTAKTAASVAEAVGKVSGGGKKASSEVERLRGELEALSKEARDAKATVEKRREDEKSKSSGAFGGVSSGISAVTFSAASLLALGRSGAAPEDKIVKAVDDHRKETAEARKVTEKVAKLLEQGWVFT